MTEEQNALARRAVACRGWRWMPGMRVDWVAMDTGWRMLSETRSWYEREECEDGEPGGPNALPDLTDPATLGCLLALVREAWWQDDMGASRYKDQWCVDVTPQEAPNYAFYAFYGASEEEALVAALEAAQ